MRHEDTSRQFQQNSKFKVSIFLHSVGLFDVETASDLVAFSETNAQRKSARLQTCSRELAQHVGVGNSMDDAKPLAFGRRLLHGEASIVESAMQRYLPRLLTGFPFLDRAGSTRPRASNRFFSSLSMA